MKLKLDEQGHVVVQDGKPVYVHEDGKEIPLDAEALTNSVRSRAEQSQRVEAENKELKDKLKAFDGLDDVESAKKALETIKNIDEGKLLSAGKVEEIKAAAKKAAEEQVAAANRSSAERISALEKDLNARDTTIHGLLIGGSFKGSPLIVGEKAKFAIPADLVEARFGQYFKVEDGKVVAFDHAGNKIFSRERPGEVASFDEALDTLLDQYPYKAQIIKASGASGGGAGSGAQKPSSGGAPTGNFVGTRAERAAAIGSMFPDLPAK